LTAALIFGGAAVYAQSSARLVGQTGTVEVQRNGMWVPLLLGEQIQAGERVRTTSGSSAAVELATDKVVTLGAATEVEVRQSDGGLNVRLESGSIRVFSAADIEVSAKDTTLQSAEKPLNMEVGYQAGALNVTVITGAVNTGPMIVRGTQDSTKRSYVADSRRAGYGSYSSRFALPLGYSSGFAYPNSFYIYPYFIYGTPGAAPPNVQSPYMGIQPGQIVPPMTDPLRPPVHFPANPFPVRPK
jgi:hypothetical protein